MAEELLELGATSRAYASYLAETAEEEQVLSFLRMVEVMESPVKREDGSRPEMSLEAEKLAVRIEQLSAKQRQRLGKAALAGTRIEYVAAGYDLGFLSDIGSALGSIGSFIATDLIPTIGTTALGILKNPELVGGILSKFVESKIQKDQLDDLAKFQSQMAQSAAAAAVTPEGKQAADQAVAEIAKTSPESAQSILSMIPGFEKAIASIGLDKVLGGSLKGFGQALGLDRILTGLGLPGVGKYLDGEEAPGISSMLESIAKQGGVIDDAVRTGQTDVVAKLDAAGRGTAAGVALERGTPAVFPIVEVAAIAGGVVVVTTGIVIAARHL